MKLAAFIFARGTLSYNFFVGIVKNLFAKISLGFKARFTLSQIERSLGEQRGDCLFWVITDEAGKAACLKQNEVVSGKGRPWNSTEQHLTARDANIFFPLT